MNPKIEIDYSNLLGYHQTLTLAKKQLVTLGGDDRKSDFGDKIQGNLLDIIDLILIDMEGKLNGRHDNTKKED